MINDDEFSAAKVKIEIATHEELINTKHEYENKILGYWTKYEYFSGHLLKYWKCIERMRYLIELINHKTLNKEGRNDGDG